MHAADGVTRSTGARAGADRGAAAVLGLGAVLVAMVVLVAGCTPTPTRDLPASGAAGPAAGPPPSAFAPLSGGDAGASDEVVALATYASEVVAAGGVTAWRSVPTFRHSDDGGRTWQEGTLDDASLRQTPLASQEQPEAVVHAPGLGGWVALGAVDRPVAWTSADGRTWSRHALASTVLDPRTDSVHDLEAGAGGYVAVGSRETGSTSRPMAWTSADGVVWRARVLPGDGVVRAVALRGTAAVAVGSTAAQDDTRAWRSTDRGATWARVRVPRVPGDGGFARSLWDVTTSGAGYVALGAAWREDWGPTLYRSTDGRRWTSDATVAGLGAGAPTLGLLLPRGDVTVAAVQRVARFAQTELGRRTGRTWQAATTPLTGTRVAARWIPEALVRSPAGWLVAVREEDSVRRRGHLWFSGDGRAFVDVGVAPSRWATGATFPSTAVLPGPGPLVVGEAQGLPVVWPGAATPGTPAAPVPLEHDSRFAVEGATGVPGRQLVWGSDLGGNSRYACVWTSTDGRTFRRTPAGAFGRYDVYGYSDIEAVRRVGDRWVAVGEQSHNGPAARSALIATSADGTTWSPGRSADRVRLTDQDTGDPVSDLTGAGDHVRAVHDVVGVAARLVAVGAAAERGDEQPAVWTTSTVHGREVWALRRLPLAGFASATMRWAESRGQEVVVLGTARRAGSGTELPFVWRSEDGGRRWAGALLPLGAADPAHVELGGLVRTDHAYVVTADVRDDVGHPVAWRSGDGRDWQPLPLTALPGSATDDRALSGVVAAGDELVGLLRIRNAAGAGARLVRQVVP